MTRLLLTGLSGSSPIGVMASYGLLRLCSQIAGLDGARLSWKRKTEENVFLDDPVAELTVPEAVDWAGFVNKVSQHIQEKDTSYFSWGEDVRVNTDLFREMLISHFRKSEGNNHEWVDVLSSLGSEIVRDGSKGLVKPSPFYMTAGKQKFLKIVHEVAESMKSETSKHLEEALFGSWKYMDDFHSLGWDPSTERIHALRERAPSFDQAKCVRAAVYLAAESLPLFPIIVVPRIKVTAVGFFRDGDGNDCFVWPLWKPPIGIDSLKSLLTLRELHEANRNRNSLIRRGIFAVYVAERSEFGKGYGIFRPAYAVWSE